MKLIILLAFILGGIYGSLHLQPTTKLSKKPIVQSLSTTTSVQAKENDSPTIQNVINEITSVFGVEGPRVILWALECSYSESKWNTFAVNVNKNYSVDRGIFQLNSIHRIPEQIAHNYKENIRIAYEMWKKQGTRPWYGSKC